MLQFYTDDKLLTGGAGMQSAATHSSWTCMLCMWMRLWKKLQRPSMICPRCNVNLCAMLLRSVTGVASKMAHPCATCATRLLSSLLTDVAVMCGLCRGEQLVWRSWQYIDHVTACCRHLEGRGCHWQRSAQCQAESQAIASCQAVPGS